MKITVRLIVSLLFVAALVAAFFSFYQVRAENKRLTSDLERRTIILADSLQESVKALVQNNASDKLKRLVERFGNRERLKGVAVYDGQGAVLASSPNLDPKNPELFPQVVSALTEKSPVSASAHIDGENIYVYIVPLEDDEVIGAIGLFHDASYIDVRLREIWKNNLLRFFTLSALIVVITIVTVRWSITGPIAQVADWMKEMRTGKGKIVQPAISPKGDLLAPLISEASQLARSLAAARTRAEEEARAKVGSAWTAQRLKEHMKIELNGKKLFLVSNREPFMHVKDGGNNKCITPAGGLVTALDPVMRICDGLWIAHGSGDADRETVGAGDKLRVPPEDPSYALRRVWLTKEEENGYYYGFSNEGIWPLCHITHTRPTFRLDDWISYQKVNEKFSEVLLDEIADEEAPLIFIQDYHLALLPLLIKEKRPDAKISLFWHIPWPNPEAYGICPWHREILMGMLGADIIGFHIQFHCNNFLDTVDRFLESQIDWERFSVTRGGHTTIVKPFPISVAFDAAVSEQPDADRKKELKVSLFKKIGVASEYLGVGVDRVDYTKGIPERLRAVERFFEKYPDFIKRFTFVELGAPSRTHIKRYRELTAEVEEMVDRINWRFQNKSWKPVVFLKAHHGHEEITNFYKGADVCMVTSLHDGMNLVAKEFVVSRNDDDGVLILSRFAGASRELADAIIVNPYDIEEMADAIQLSLTMDAQERTARMARMRTSVKEHNIYRWAGNLITSLARLRLPEEGCNVERSE
ncbi:MAG: trehalose-6-phosphate synthase [Nitrospiraceae bacterium]|nr:trehalose-6-phosphate synthase [Nitrospiraceae bacterium]